MTIDPKNGLWLLPSNRPEELKKFFAAAVAMGMTTRGYVCIADNSEADNYLEAIPEGWMPLFTNEKGFAAALQGSLENMGDWPSKHCEWIGVLSDDLVPETPNWDTKLISRLNGWNAVASNDGCYAPKSIKGAICFSTALLDAVGYLAPPGLQHFGFDNTWLALGAATNCLEFALDVMVRHPNRQNFLMGPNEHDARLETFRKEDDDTFQQWKRERMPFDVKAIGELMKQQGVELVDLDFSKLRLLIATPCGNHRLHQTYVKSLIETIVTLRELGATVAWSEISGSANLPNARAILMGRFLASDYTHMLQVDDDMGWSVGDVIKMLSHKRDFIAGAGILQGNRGFAATSMDELGNAVPFELEMPSGLLSMTSVGGAFVLVTKACMQKMADSYPELEFTPIRGLRCWGVYHPDIAGKLDVGEDYVFCKRWKAIGGKVWVMPSVRLSHAGETLMIGAFEDVLGKVMTVAADEETQEAAE